MSTEFLPTQEWMHARVQEKPTLPSLQRDEDAIDFLLNLHNRSTVDARNFVRSTTVSLLGDYSSNEEELQKEDLYAIHNLSDLGSEIKAEACLPNINSLIYRFLDRQSTRSRQFPGLEDNALRSMLRFRLEFEDAEEKMVDFWQSVWNIDNPNLWPIASAGVKKT